MTCKLTLQVKFLALLGPFLSLSTLFILLFKSSAESFFLAIILLSGVLLCWKWKLWGVVGSTIAVTALLTYRYHQIPLDERFWYLGMGLSISTGLFITALSFEEVDALIDALQIESKSRLENLLKVDEKQIAAEKLLQKKEAEIQELQNKLRYYQKLLDLSGTKQS